jgi:hypothetical protein
MFQQGETTDQQRVGGLGRQFCWLGLRQREDPIAELSAFALSEELDLLRGQQGEEVRGEHEEFLESAVVGHLNC